MDNPTLIQRIIAYNAQQRATPPQTPNPPIPPPPVPTWAQTAETRIAALEARVTALENRS